ncbi:hypothetical protein [Streptomyces sp. NPDC058739]|uniref:hypothetical protein n=1 Tax=Streptomyces sp. NPDC058739 TaxID=3346618 RepID=UPI0036795AC1
MTQSGQGEEPSARPAREGVVLPSDGGAPLLPGGPTATPPGGQAWGTPWGPEARQSPAPGRPSWPQPADQQWGAAPPAPGAQPHGSAPAAPSAGPLPPEAPATASYGYPQDGYGAPSPQGGTHSPQGGTHSPQGGTHSPQGGTHSPQGGTQSPQRGYGYPQDGYGAPSAQGGSHGPQGGTYGGSPLPPAADDATRYIPPVAPGGDDGATQYIPPVAAAAPAVDEGATQYIPPVTPGALPPEMPGASYGAPAAPQGSYGGPAGAYGGAVPEAPAETTTFLGTGPGAAGPGAGGRPPAGADAEATQYIPPVPAGGDRQPPAEFAGLFRDEQGPSGATQQMPRVQAPQGGYAPQQQYDRHGGGGHGSSYPGDGRRDDGGRGRGSGTGSRVPVIAAVGIGIAVLGIGAGALMGSDGGGDDDTKNVSASTPATAESSSPSASASPSDDPAKAQAEELDKLLADSGNSRASVINAVGNVRGCKDLGKAAQDLRAAAQQRNGLVTRLEGLAVDQLPGNGELKTALTNAWKASASADDHYAAWADQVAGNKKKFCRGGTARSTGQTQAGDRASGTATAEKGRAAGLWNTIADKYGLTRREPTQL